MSSKNLFVATAGTLNLSVGGVTLTAAARVGSSEERSCGWSFHTTLPSLPLGQDVTLGVHGQTVVAHPTDTKSGRPGWTANAKLHGVKGYYCQVGANLRTQKDGTVTVNVNVTVIKSKLWPEGEPVAPVVGPRPQVLTPPAPAPKKAKPAVVSAARELGQPEPAGLTVDIPGLGQMRLVPVAGGTFALAPLAPAAPAAPAAPLPEANF
jgi:hypothetical protein